MFLIIVFSFMNVIMFPSLNFFVKKTSLKHVLGLFEKVVFLGIFESILFSYFIM
jgi:hypothetical protein